MKISAAVLTLGLAFTVSGCDAFNSEFNKQFDTQFRTQCVAEATKQGAPQDMAKKACDCTLKAGKSETDFNMPSEEEQLAAAQECLQEMGVPAAE